MLAKKLAGFFMSKSKTALSAIDIQRRVKEGRGKGEGKTYKPWLTVNDVPSSGRSHRVYSFKTGRVHHLLSDLELAVFLVLEWSNNTSDIREQFPLILEETKNLALEHEIAHPSVKGMPQVMTSDFLVDTLNGTQKRFVIQAKYVSDLYDNRTVEKLELERLYWKSKNIPWFIVTEKDISKNVHDNINWLHSAKSGPVNLGELAQQLPFLKKSFTENPASIFINICKKIDMDYDIPQGSSLRDLRILIAYGFIRFDLRQKYNTLKCKDFNFSIVNDMEVILEVAN